MSRFFQPISIAHRLYESAFGSLKKPPIIMMHGFMENKEKWGPIADILASESGRKVYTYDARNHGESEHTMDSNFENNVQDLYHFMDKMKIHESVLVGHNMGGMTAIRAALEQPDRVEAAFIVDMQPNDIPFERVCYFECHLQTLSLHQYYTIDDAPRPNLALVRFPPPGEKLQKNALLKKSVILFRGLALVDALRIYHETPKIAFQGKFIGPAYFIYGTSSKYYPFTDINEIMNTIEHYFPRASFGCFDGPTSRGVFDAPKEFATYVARKLTPQDFCWFY